MRLQIDRIWLRGALLLGGAGFILSWVLIYTSASYGHAREFLESDQKIRDEFGNVKFDVLYLANEQNHQSNGRSSGTARFSFYVFAEKKNGTISIEADEDSGVWRVYSIRPVANVQGFTTGNKTGSSGDAIPKSEKP
jgi:hypothetical protein